MNPTFIVTDEMVLRWPFAVNPARITSEMEQDIARRMAAQARKEGHDGRLPAMKPHQIDRAAEQAQAEAQVLEVMRDGVPRSSNRIRLAIRHDKQVVEHVISKLLSRGALYVAGIAASGPARGRAQLYAMKPQPSNQEDLK